VLPSLLGEFARLHSGLRWRPSPPSVSPLPSSSVRSV
jgi:hypothetical protein